MDEEDDVAPLDGDFSNNSNDLVCIICLKKSEKEKIQKLYEKGVASLRRTSEQREDHELQRRLNVESELFCAQELSKTVHG